MYYEKFLLRHKITHSVLPSSCALCNSERWKYETNKWPQVTACLDSGSYLFHRTNNGPMQKNLVSCFERERERERERESNWDMHVYQLQLLNLVNVYSTDPLLEKRWMEKKEWWIDANERILRLKGFFVLIKLL